jgi:hypothetical protein
MDKIHECDVVNTDFCLTVLKKRLPSSNASTFAGSKWFVKIILSTNLLAESCVTIGDVSHCINTSIVKESRFSGKKRIKELVSVYCSRRWQEELAGDLPQRILGISNAGTNSPQNDSGHH